MTISLKSAVALLSVVFSLPAWAAAEPAGAPPPQVAVLKVALDATGRVQAATSIDPQTQPAVVQAAQAHARNLVFAPARKGGVGVPSETILSLVLAAEPTADGNFAFKLRRASNGPGVVSVGKMVPPRNLGRNSGATIIVSVEVDAQGKPDIGTFKAESVQLRSPGTFAEARYLDAIRNTLRNSVFEPERVGGVPVPSRISMPYRFGRGGAKPAKGEEQPRRGAPPPPPPDPTDQPTMQAVSLQPGVELPKVDFRAESAG